MKRGVAIGAAVGVLLVGALACEGEGPSGGDKGFPIRQNASCTDPGERAVKNGTLYECQRSGERARWHSISPPKTPIK